MRHVASPQFWQRYDKLPQRIRSLADRTFETLKRDPSHPSVQLKPAAGYWSARIGLRYRALGIRDGDDMVWFWIGSHADYDGILKR